MKRILIVTDAWAPQVNGVVRTLTTVVEHLRDRGHVVEVLNPNGRKSIPLPTYREIRLTLTTAVHLGAEISAFAPDYIYIATEGPLGFAARRYCIATGLRFTTGFHTRLPEYINVRLPGTRELAWRALRWFHRQAANVLTPTTGMVRELEARGFENVQLWSRGVDHAVFRPVGRDAFDLPRPISMYFGRVAPEKSVEEFLNLQLPGSKVVVGDGPDAGRLTRLYPDVHFAGYCHGEKLVHALSSADVMVFPSKTDTFGLVMIEAMACGTPIAAYPITSPIDIVQDGRSGALSNNLTEAVHRALTLDRLIVQEAARDFTWQRTVNLFEDYLVPAHIVNRQWQSDQKRWQSVQRSRPAS